ncbi:MAG: hypothetical protein EHM12_11130 [Dehalococcoidia bacterium]|nr:MAG: hypothetical protein EHM12_11130 [Dehalococcoidia bacterium]
MSSYDSILSAVGVSGLINPSSYSSMWDTSAKRTMLAKQMEEEQRLGRDKFALDKMMAMQQYKANAEKMQWKKDFARYLGSVGGI